jgi:hypothetical protein
MSRFAYVLKSAVSSRHPPLLELAQQFVNAVQETLVEGAQPENDPAVLVLGTRIAFHTHADVNTYSGFERLMKLCNDRHEATPQVMQ